MSDSQQGGSQQQQTQVPKERTRWALALFLPSHAEMDDVLADIFGALSADEQRENTIWICSRAGMPQRSTHPIHLVDAPPVPMSDADVERRLTGASRASRAVRHISQRMRSKPESTFAPSDILPEDGYTPYPKRPESDFRPSYEDNPEQIFGAPAEPMSANGSVSPPSVFDAPDGRQEYGTEATTQASDEPGDYDLKPPPPNKSHANVEELGIRFFSNDHLDHIVRDQNSGQRFVQFLEQFRPQYSTQLQHYIQARKAMTAIEYANSIADNIPAGRGELPYVAASVDEAFDAKSKAMAEDLVEEALPAYLTHRLTSVVTETLVKTITGNSIPAMQDLIPNLAEVYCITDPALPDNPIVYASDEFYNTTQYGRDYVIGRNCRFLQGPRTSEATVRRMAEALSAGEELCETILNYRRDGTPFMNLLLLSPMYDNKGEVRYYLGCQIDVSPLIEAGKGLDSFSQLLAQDRANSRSQSNEMKDPMNLLSELGQMLSDTETDFVSSKIRRSNSRPSSGHSTPAREPQQQQQQRRPNNRRILSMDDSEGQRPMGALWPDANLGRSGRLPGVYRNYLLVRPYPSLRITFTSPTLRIPGLLQTKLLDRIGGPEHLKSGILDAFRSGNGVTAKVPWLATTSSSPRSPTARSGEGNGKPRWIHCTPLVGSDEKVGVWMVVLVENEEVTGLLNRQGSGASASRGGDVSRGTSRAVHSGAQQDAEIELGPVDGNGRTDSTNAMYADYLRGSKEGTRPGTAGTGATRVSKMKQREVDGHFRDF
ncbi:uncharacterized protein LTR77_006548 [Saxophila tyrrhenica]|uniref:PAC domain-containing protein n=1 Tax=Saxophila tyrrhenica TaxID=1690608 RepID=A0AAV9P975_9PEZI|nr:hypothetical protein LTR77_006548 [Saxophila tyrrhenica]